MKRTIMPIAGGILCIIGSIFGGFLVSGLLELASCNCFGPSEPPGWPAEFAALFMLAIAYLALAGGFCSFQRKKWNLVMAGSIATLLYTGPLGIAAMVLTILAKKEFQ
jgi:hypothetical protein